MLGLLSQLPTSSGEMAAQLAESKCEQLAVVGTSPRWPEALRTLFFLQQFAKAGNHDL